MLELKLVLSFKMLEDKEITWEMNKKAKSWTSYPEVFVWYVDYFSIATVINHHELKA